MEWHSIWTPELFLMLTGMKCIVWDHKKNIRYLEHTTHWIRHFVEKELIQWFNLNETLWQKSLFTSKMKQLVQSDLYIYIQSIYSVAVMLLSNLRPSSIGIVIINIPIWPEVYTKGYLYLISSWECHYKGSLEIWKDLTEYFWDIL